MNDADRKAFDMWWEYGKGNHGEQFDAWKAACEWRDSQVGEPVGYISQDELNILLSGKAGNHMTVGLDTREAWPKGSNESVPYDWLVALYTAPPTDQINQQLVKLLDKCVILINEFSGEIEVAYIANLIQESEAAITKAKGEQTK